jgi:hypothetical protein
MFSPRRVIMTDDQPASTPKPDSGDQPVTGRGDTLKMGEAWAHLNLPKPGLKPSPTGFGKPRRRR